MRLFLVSYDLINPGQAYPPIVGRLEALGAKKVLFSEWMLRGSMTATQLRDDLQRYMDANDQLLVIDISGSEMAWTRLQIDIKPTFNLT